MDFFLLSLIGRPPVTLFAGAAASPRGASAAGGGKVMLRQAPVNNATITADSFVAHPLNG